MTKPAFLLLLIYSGAAPVAGLEAPPRIVLDINAQPGNTLPPEKTVFLNGAMLFAFSADGRRGTELWRSDGTPQGGYLLRDIASGLRGSDPADFMVAGSICYFTADDGAHGRELWLTDGTGGGTRLVKDIRPGAGGSNPGSFAAAGGWLYFAADDGVSGRELWKTDGTPDGTTLAKDIHAG
jgi:ELWxxDGT repeat protein